MPSLILFVVETRTTQPVANQYMLNKYATLKRKADGHVDNSTALG